MITKIIFIALPGVGDNDIELVIRRSIEYDMPIILKQSYQNFGEFGYEQILSQPFELMEMDSLLISQPLNSGLRLLYQVRERISELESHEYIYNESSYDYPLLAIETGTVHDLVSPCIYNIYNITVPDPLNCIMGLLNISELKNMWEHRPPPVVYTSPYKVIPLDCNGVGTVTRILAGGYEVMYGVNDVGINTSLSNCSTTFHTHSLTYLHRCIGMCVGRITLTLNRC